jgi:hypothetical protein
MNKKRILVLMGGITCRNIQFVLACLCTLQTTKNRQNQAIDWQNIFITSFLYTLIPIQFYSLIGLNLVHLKGYF